MIFFRGGGGFFYIKISNYLNFYLNVSILFCLFLLVFLFFYKNTGYLNFCFKIRLKRTNSNVLVYVPVLKLHFALCDIAPCNRESCYTSTQVFDDDLQPCFERVSAYVKGYLTRRLLKTEKVQEIVRTIQVNDTVHVSSEQQKVGIYYGYSFKI